VPRTPPPDPSPRRPHQHGHRERLRQRFLANPAGGLADYELLELYLAYAIPRRDVKPLAKALLARYGDLAGVFAAPPADLRAQPGVGPAATVLLRLLPELRARLLRQAATADPRFGGWPATATLAAYARQRLTAAGREQALVLYFNAAGEWLRHEELAEGGRDQTAVFPRQVVESALARQAASVVLCHSHPSGVAEPSPADLASTADLVGALALLELRLHDHLILAGEDCFSFREHGLLPD